MTTPRSTGRLVNHDPRNRDHEAPRRAVRPISWLHRRGPTLDQGDRNGCVGWTWADLLNCPSAAGSRRVFNATYATRFTTHYLDDGDGENLYRLSTEYDPFPWTFPPTDGGSSALGGAKGLHKMGVIDGYDWTFDFANALAWAQRQPVALGILWTEPMSDPDRNGVIHIGTDRDLKRADDAGMGHEVLWRGCRWDRKLARITNHWTQDWGLDGDALIPVEELERLVITYRGDVCVPKLLV